MKVMLGDSHTTSVVGIETVKSKFTSRRNLMLKNAMHTLEMRKFFVFGFLLNNAGFTKIIRSDLYAITKMVFLLVKDMM